MSIHVCSVANPKYYDKGKITKKQKIVITLLEKDKKVPKNVNKKLV